MVASWLVHSKETTNFTYDLTPINREHLAWFISEIAGTGVGEIRGYLDEIAEDDNLRGHLKAATQSSDLRRFADVEPRYGRRIGWYALIRALRPQHVVETGTDKGLGSCVLAAALLANGVGRLTTIDIETKSGYLISGKYAEVTTRIVDDSLDALPKLTGVDLFLHDSDHTQDHEGKELRAVTPSLTPEAVLLSDNAHWSNELPKWAEAHHRKFSFFREDPDEHWYLGCGIGVAWGHGQE
jgi:predicted O-methyltransferase YrrM